MSLFLKCMWWLKVANRMNKRALRATLLSRSCDHPTDFTLSHRCHHIACRCVCLCLTRRTSAQNTVSTARAASCLRKAGLPVQRALLQGCRCVSLAPVRRIRTRLYSVKKRRELKYTLQRRHSRDLLLEYKQMWICLQPFFFPLFDWWHTAETSLSGKPRRPHQKRPSDPSRHETSRTELNSAETGG